MIIKAGQRIPADIRIIECSSDFAVDQSCLTGESEPCSKSTEIIQDEIPLEAKNLLFYGTYCVKGSCKGIVYGVGDETFMGRVAHLAIGYDSYEVDPAIRKVKSCKGVMSCFICIVSVVCFILGLVLDDDMIISILWFCLVVVIIIGVYSLVGYFWNARFQLIKALVNDGKLRIKSEECLQTLPMVDVLCTKAENVLLDWNGNVIDGLSELMDDTKKLNVKMMIFCGNQNEKNMISKVIGIDNVKVIDDAKVDIDWDTFVESDEFRDVFNGYEVVIVHSDEMKGYKRLLAVHGMQMFGHIVGYIGSEVDDAPPLKKSDIGISFNDERCSTDIAKEAADIICLSSSLESVITSIKISKGISSNQ